MHLFPDDYPGGAERSATVWDCTGPLPVLRRMMRCPVCGIGELAIKDWKFHNRRNVGSRTPWRCDVRLKCMTCGCVQTAGVLVPEAMFEANVKARGAKANTWLHWRDGKKLLAEHERK